MRARQIECCDKNMDKARAHLQQMRMQDKKYYDQTKRLISETSNIGNLVLLHDTKLESSHSAKLNFRWNGPYRIRGILSNKGSYFLEELDGTPLAGSIHGNRLKKFWLRDPKFDIPEKQNMIGDPDRMPDTESTESNPDTTQQNENAQWIPPGQDFAVLI